MKQYLSLEHIIKGEMMSSKHLRRSTLLTIDGLALPVSKATEAMTMFMNFIVDKNSERGVLDLNGNEFYASNAC